VHIISFINIYMGMPGVARYPNSFVACVFDVVSIDIYKEECLSVCLFAMHSVPVIASATKLSMALL
jgi:hypothetical protein